ncbi:MAG: metalloregulator ArsR/SmtB family transcription factor [Marinilabiliales bacterium]|nr:metalloregulator ArsR/SmtB family transcription factor [Marinilabiliales bacterium]
MEPNEQTLEKLTVAAEMLKAIAHPMRISIVSYLEGDKKLTVTEIYERLGIEQSATSHHLGILKSKGVLASSREGKNTYYFLKHSGLSGILKCVESCQCHN